MKDSSTAALYDTHMHTQTHSDSQSETKLFKKLTKATMDINLIGIGVNAKTAYVIIICLC